MNTPRIRLSRLSTPSDAQRDVQGNGASPLLRPREPSQRGMSLSLGARVRRLAKPLPAAGVLFCLVALVGYLGVYAASSKRTPVLVAARSLSAGTVISEGDVRVGKLAGEGSVISSLVPAGERSVVVGQRLASAVPAGAPLPVGVLAGHGISSSVLTLAVPEFDVTGENLQPGDRISVLATYGAGSGGAASTRAIARSLQVLSVGEAPASAQASTSTIAVTVALGEPGSASQLVLAEQDGKIDTLLEGSTSTATIPQASQESKAP